MKKKELMEILAVLQDENGNINRRPEDVLRQVAIINKRAKAESTKRSMESDRRKTFNVLKPAKQLSYEQMTAYVWRFVAVNMDMFKSWLDCNYPDVLKREESVNRENDSEA